MFFFHHLLKDMRYSSLPSITGARKLIAERNSAIRFWVNANFSASSSSLVFLRSSSDWKPASISCSTLISATLATCSKPRPIPFASL